MKAGAIKEMDAHIFEKVQHEHYVENHWVDRILFDEVEFIGDIFDPCCGFGRIPEAARKAGFDAGGSDIVDRGFPGTKIINFLDEYNHLDGHKTDNIVMNPPFEMSEQFIRKACRVARDKIASIYPTRRLNAAHWLTELPLQMVLYLTPRPSMPPGWMARQLEAIGKDASGGKQDFCWLIFERVPSPMAKPRVGWLHRDKGLIW